MAIGTAPKLMVAPTAWDGRGERNANTHKEIRMRANGDLARVLL